MTVCVAVDCGLTCGITYEPQPGHPEAVPLRLGKGMGNAGVGIEYGRPFHTFRTTLRGIIVSTRASVVGFEAPLPVRMNRKGEDGHHHGGDAGFTLTQSTIRVLYGLPAIIEELCHELRVRCVEANVMTVKKHLTGTGHASKEQVRAAVKTYLGMSVSDHNAADSAALWAFLKSTYSKGYFPPGSLLGRARR